MRHYGPPLKINKIFLNPEIRESTIFPRHDREPSRASAKTEPWCACNLPFHFSGETKEIIFVESALERELYAKVSSGPKKCTTWSLHKKKPKASCDDLGLRPERIWPQLYMRGSAEQRRTILILVIISRKFRARSLPPPPNFLALLLRERVNAAREPASSGDRGVHSTCDRGWKFSMIARCEHTEAQGTPTAFRLPVKLNGAGHLR